MEDPNKFTPPPFDPGAAPAQPEAHSPLKRSMPAIMVLGAIIALIGVANFTHFLGGAKETPKSALPMRPASPNAQQVASFAMQQSRLTKQDQDEQLRLQQLSAQIDQLKREQEVPGPESPNAPPMTPAQRDAMYGAGNPNAPRRTSPASQVQAEARQRGLAREKLHLDALASDTVAIDFAHASAEAAVTGRRSTSPVTQAAAGNESSTQVASNEAGEASAQRGEDTSATPRDSATQAPASKDQAPLSAYDFDRYDGRLFRVFEGTVFEGVVTNHIDGALAGPILVMLTTDYYSHDHQQLLLPQGTRLIGNVQSVGASQQRKLLVVFNRAICPDGFSIDLNKFTGLDPVGTTGLASNVDNHYLSSFAAAAAVGGLGGLAQIGNGGSVLDSGTQLRNGISSQTSQEGMRVLEKFLDRLPVITVKEGSRARVYINRDLLLPSYAGHRVDPVL